MSDPTIAPAAPPSPDDVPLDDRVARVGLAWRELRRGASMQKLRERIYGHEGQMLDLTLADALEVLSLTGPARVGDLATALRVDPSTATRTVDRLVRQGLAERVPDPDDARAVRVAATEAGLAIRERVRDQARAALGEILQEFSPEEADTLAGLMTRLVAAVDRYVGAEPSPEE